MNTRQPNFPAVQWASLMGRAVLLSILLSDPLHVASDSDEEVQGPSEWQTWKRSNGVSYDKKGDCGSCWAFSTTGAIEGQMFKRTGQLVSLSEQNLVDCSKRYGTNGCSGAWMANAYDYVLQNELQSTDTHPYTSVDSQPCFYESSQSVARITD
ncbi:procathepsin L-like [Oncorhynchus nerka]|uniref:procathepsin L-like n=1 Tax=Oncorhynchus nerka TaxID=8023 RepID=UPI0031B8A021